jgi:cell wall-associated NlpC family hydrolase
MGHQAILGLVVVGLVGCAAAPPVERVEAGADAAQRAAQQAAKMVGRPYRYGGSSPSSGFDCSGLVFFSYRQAGVRLPRSTEDQLLASSPVALSELRHGDLLFFDQEGKKSSHVGIYLGGGRFVHAPSSGKYVRTDELGSSYWKRHLSDTRRF